MTKLNQIIAIESGEKGKATKFKTALYREIQKLPLLSGISRTYQPKDDDGDKLPAESTRVQLNAETLLAQLGDGLTRLFDVTLTKETSNQTARADVVVDDNTILRDVPVTYLLFLEKQLVDLHTFVLSIPTLDPSEVWTYDANQGAYATQAVQTVKTKKVPRNWVKAEATDKHPAQVEVYHEDVVVGYWTTTRFSGALPLTEPTKILTRIDTLSNAVKFAREAANNTDVTDAKAGLAIFGYLFS